MSPSQLDDQIEDLDGHIDDLEQSLAPLLETALSTTTSKLPLLDRAKLHVLLTYAIESILFSSLRLNGVNAKQHAVFQELSRVKQYFAKIKTVETGGEKRVNVLDKKAAVRFIRAGLAGNSEMDHGQRGQADGGKAAGKRRFEDSAVGTHTRFDGVAKRIKAQEAAEGETVRVVSAKDIDTDDDEKTKTKKQKQSKLPKDQASDER